VQEYRLTPSFTSDTHILILTAGGARWTQIRDARCGATVIQSLRDNVVYWKTKRKINDDLQVGPDLDLSVCEDLEVSQEGLAIIE